jgi:hypothetical protein
MTSCLGDLATYYHTNAIIPLPCLNNKANQEADRLPVHNQYVPAPRSLLPAPEDTICHLKADKNISLINH